METTPLQKNNNKWELVNWGRSSGWLEMLKFTHLKVSCSIPSHVNFGRQSSYGAMF